jgi:hypothetical protein
MTEERTIDGHQIELSEGRKVWAGEVDDSWYIKFDDGKGNERSIRISYEAAGALMKLLTYSPHTLLRYVLKIQAGEVSSWEQWEPELETAVTSNNRGGE